MTNIDLHSSLEETQAPVAVGQYFSPSSSTVPLTSSGWMDLELQDIKNKRIYRSFGLQSGLVTCIGAAAARLWM